MLVVMPPVQRPTASVPPCMTVPCAPSQLDVPVKVQIQLKRPSDKQYSEARPFTLTPVDCGECAARDHRHDL